jgi:hypothetical protein
MNGVDEEDDADATILFTKYDLYRLERIAGTVKAKKMSRGLREVYVEI